MHDEPWARRIRKERAIRGWTQKECAQRLQYESTREIPELRTLLNQWKRWEAGRVTPSVKYQRMIASMFGSVSAAFFAPRSPQEIVTAAAPNADSELLARLQRSAVDQATLDGLRMAVDRLCADYPTVPAEQLLTEGQAWLSRVADLLDTRLTLSQHREIVSLAGTLALLVGCLQMDLGASTAAEATRRSALSLGTESEDLAVVGWAHEMLAWFCLTKGDYRGVLSASEAGVAAAGGRSVSVQLHAQTAKAWSRIGDRGKVEVALDKGRRLLEELPPPEDTSHHFVVDPSKWDFYAMDVLRRVGDHTRADALADEVLERGTDWSGRVVSPMRCAEALITKGVVAAKQGDLEGAVVYGDRALDGDRQSRPSLSMVGRELGEILVADYRGEPAAEEYVEQLRALSTS